MRLAYDGSQVDIVDIIFKIVTIIGFKCKVVVAKTRLAAGLIVSARDEKRPDIINYGFIRTIFSAVLDKAIRFICD